MNQDWFRPSARLTADGPGSGRSSGNAGLKRRMRRALSMVVALLSVSVAAPAAAAAATPASPPVAPFHAAGKWLVDAQGRVVVTHGFDIIQKTSPFYPSSFAASDASFLAGEGVTAARIGFIWAGVEPQPGVYDDTYIHQIVNLAQVLESAGIHPLIDFHQDGYGVGSGDGAPKWAELGNSTDTDFEAFWDNQPASDGVGVQTHYINAWKHVVQILDASPAGAGALGLDPFNEPYPGSGYKSPCGNFAPCPAFEQTQLPAFYNQLIAAVRSVGDTHMIFPEGIADSGTAEPALPKFSDPEVGFNWHFYCPESGLIPDPTPITQAICSGQDATARANILKYTSALGVPWLVSEFGANDANDEYANEVDWMDSNFLSWTEWMYYQALGGPASAPGQGLLYVDALGGSEANANQSKLDALVVPYAEAIAGTPETYAYNRSTNTMTLTYLAQGVPGATLSTSAQTLLFVPSRHYSSGYKLAVTNGHEVSSQGQWVEIAANAPGDQVTVTVGP